MISAIKWIIKLAITSALILVLGNWIHWDGKTVSDQVKSQLSHAERSNAVGRMKDWANQLTEDAKKGISRKVKLSAPAKAAKQTSFAEPLRDRITMNEVAAADEDSDGATVAKKKEKLSEEGISPPNEEIPSSERQKLRALIKDLKTAHGRN